MTRYPPQWLQQGTYAASVDRRLLGFAYPAPFVRGGAVTVATGMGVNVAAGQAMIPTGNATGSTLCSWDATELTTLAAAPASGSNRYDLIVVQARGNDLDGGTNNDFIVTNITGTAAATPAIPATPANANLLAHVYVAGGSAAVVAGNITDRRFLGYWRGSRTGAWSTGGGNALGMDNFADGRGNTQPYQWGLTVNAFTVPWPGLYYAGAIASYTSTAAQQFAVTTLYKNGTGWFNGPPSFSQSAANILGGIAQSIVPCAAADTLQLYFQASQVGTAGATGGNFTSLTIAYLGP